MLGFSTKPNPHPRNQHYHSERLTKQYYNTEFHQTQRLTNEVSLEVQPDYKK
jgi:hypothetical protein